jgi:hypothetical protein
MLFLLQLLNTLNKKQFDLFMQLFSDLDYELNEMGYSSDPQGLVNEMLSNHFGIELTDVEQLNAITRIILDKNKFESTLRYHKITKNWN